MALPQIAAFEKNLNEYLSRDRRVASRREDVALLFDGATLLAPGVVPLSRLPCGRLGKERNPELAMTKERLRALQEPQVERPENQDNPDVHYQSFPEAMSEEQEIQADHDGYHREHIKRDGYLSAHGSRSTTRGQSAARAVLVGRAG